MPRVEHPYGNYEFLPGIAPYSCGVVALPGFEIVHVRYLRPINYRPGLDRIATWLDAIGRPKAALCAIELRSPVPFSFAGFGELNADYAGILRNWGIFVNGVNPVARTNVAPEVHAPDSVVIHGFSYTRPAPAITGKTFVVAGGGELPEGRLDAESIVARGDVSPDGLVKKARFVAGLMENRLLGLGAGWGEVTA
ncbi:MAG: RidA family protein, partial [bacterium]